MIMDEFPVVHDLISSLELFPTEKDLVPPLLAGQVAR
jgi:hypothetical protein